MRRFLSPVLLVAAFVGGFFVPRMVAHAAYQPQNAATAEALCVSGTPVWVGTITTATAGTPLDNTNTAVPFTLQDGAAYMFRTDVAQFVQPVASASEVDAHAVLYQANALPCWSLPGGVTTVSADPKVTGATNLFVFRMNI